MSIEYKNGLSENEYNFQRDKLETVLDELAKTDVDIEDILKSKNLMWDDVVGDSDYLVLLEAKTKEVYNTLYNDPLNNMQKYFPLRFEGFGESSKLWWMALINRAQIIRPVNEKGKPTNNPNV